MPEELWMEVCDIVQETGIKTIPTEKKDGNNNPVYETAKDETHGYRECTTSFYKRLSIFGFWYP